MTFLEKLKEATRLSNSLLCVGLDTDARSLPECLKNDPNPVLTFNKAIIDATKHVAASYKLNIAYYEAQGETGIGVIRETLAHIPKNLITILDSKRGDIGNTARQYAITYQEHFACDAITVNPLMGYDSAEPFLTREDRGVFFLGLTSNPGAKDFEYLELKNGKRLFEEITDTVVKWNVAKRNCGLVVGATKPEELQALRKRAPELPFLIPGVGAQGGSLEEVVRANGKGAALINVSRGIAGASLGDDFQKAAADAAQRIVAEMRHLRM